MLEMRNKPVMENHLSAIFVDGRRCSLLSIDRISLENNSSFLYLLSKFIYLLHPEQFSSK